MNPSQSCFGSMRRRVSRSECGFVLITAMLFLIALTIIGLSAIGSNILEERMSGQARDRQIAVEAAEAALRDGERFISSQDPDPNFFSVGCGTSGASKGLCKPAETGAPIWRQLDAKNDSDLEAWLNDHTIQFGTTADATPVRFTVSPDPDNSTNTIEPASQPRFFIEILRSPVNTQYPPIYPYRITAVGYGRHQTTRVILQSIYIPIH